MVSFQKKFFLIRFIEGLLFLQKMETSYLETDYLSWKGDLVQLIFYRVGTYIGFDIKMELILSNNFRWLENVFFLVKHMHDQRKLRYITYSEIWHPTEHPTDVHWNISIMISIVIIISQHFWFLFLKYMDKCQVNGIFNRKKYRNFDSFQIIHGIFKSFNSVQVVIK